MTIALHDEVRVLGLPGPYRNIEHVIGDSVMLVEHMETLEVTEVLVKDVVLFNHKASNAERNSFPDLCTQGIPDTMGIYDSIFLVDNDINQAFIICDTYEKTGVLEVESEYFDSLYFLNPNQVKKVW